jgi:hypothetical protein
MIPRRRKSEPRAKPSKAHRLCSTSRKVIKQARVRAQQTGEDPALAEHAAMIHRLGKRVIKDIIEIGRRIQIAKSLVGHGNWGRWLEREFGWTDDTALNFMRVYELSDDLKSRNFRDLKIAPSALYLLARKSTPEKVKNEIIERAESGEAITVKDVKTATESETAMASRTNDWREDVRRGFRQALTLANDCVAFGQQAQGEFSPELEQQMREVYEPLRRQLPEAKKKAQGLVDYFDRIETILNNGAPVVLAEVAE